MRTKILILTLLLALATISFAKPVYDFKTSYVTQLTDFNFKDQVTKIRQNTNYVSLVQFYKYNGNTSPMQMENHSLLLSNLMNGCTSTTECSEWEQWTAMSIPNCARRKTLRSIPPSRSILLLQFPQPPSQYLSSYTVIIHSRESPESSCKVPALQRDRNNKRKHQHLHSRESLRPQGAAIH